MGCDEGREPWITWEEVGTPPSHGAPRKEPQLPGVRPSPFPIQWVTQLSKELPHTGVWPEATPRKYLLGLGDRPAWVFPNSCSWATHPQS